MCSETASSSGETALPSGGVRQRAAASWSCNGTSGSCDRSWLNGENGEPGALELMLATRVFPSNSFIEATRSLGEG
jgi:hypothetical protein